MKNLSTIQKTFDIDKQEINIWGVTLITLFCTGLGLNNNSFIKCLKFRPTKRACSLIFLKQFQLRRWGKFWGGRWTCGRWTRGGAFWRGGAEEEQLNNSGWVDVKISEVANSRAVQFPDTELQFGWGRPPKRRRRTSVLRRKANPPPTKLQQTFSKINKNNTCDILSRLGYRKKGHIKIQFSPFQPHT